jgi:hypothetical protein
VGVSKFWLDERVGLWWECLNFGLMRGLVFGGSV